MNKNKFTYKVGSKVLMRIATILMSNFSIRFTKATESVTKIAGILAPIIILASSLVLLVACEQKTETYRPNIIVISVDTLRADHIPTYGYPQATAPHIDAFANNAVIFDKAYTPASHTLLAHASLLTGVYPETHGVISHDNSLPDDMTTLTEILKRDGYNTGAFVNAGYFDPKFKFDRGFSKYDYITNTYETKINDQIQFGRTAGQTNQAIFDWLKQDSKKPFFLFAHYFDVHSDLTDLPYESPDDFRIQFEIERQSVLSPATELFRHHAIFSI